MLAAALAAALPLAASATDYRIVHEFGALVLASNGRIYGTTLRGGKDGFGTVFSIKAK